MTNFNATGIYNITSIYLGNTNYTGASETWFVNVLAVIDTVKPYFTNNTPQNQTITYANALSYDINATDETVFSCFIVNDSRFKINCNGLLENNTVLGVALYSLNITINDTSNNINSTIMFVNVTQKGQSITTLLNGNNANLVITYPQKINASYNGNNQTALSININGTLVNAAQNYSWGAGIWFVNYSIASNQNYSGNETYLNLTINPATGIINGSINGTDTNFTTINGSFNKNILINTINLSGDSNGKIYLNGTVINSGLLPLSNLTNLSIGYYNITFVYDGNQNYTSDSKVLWVNISLDTAYPIFSNFVDNTGTLTGSGTATFGVTVQNTNGTVLLQINNANYSATNTTSEDYTALVSMSTGDYNYNWVAFGNGGNNNLNSSITRIYSVASSGDGDNPGPGGPGPCSYDWICEDWQDCINGNQSRVCTNHGTCTGTVGKPVELRSCSSNVTNCTYNWACGDWQDCINGNQSRVCTNHGTCTGTVGKPSEMQICSLNETNCTYQWVCQDWQDCINGNQSRVCDNHGSCSGNLGKPSEMKSCYSNDTGDNDNKITKKAEEEVSKKGGYWICGEWSSCNAAYDLNNIITGNVMLEGEKERVCKDNENKYSKIEKIKCNTEMSVTTKKVSKCYRNYLEVYDSNGTLVSRLDLPSQISGKLNIQLEVNEKGYCDYCYNKVKDYDENETDCVYNEDGSCPVCGTQLIETPFVVRRNYSWISWLLLILAAILLIWVLYESVGKIEFYKFEEKKKDSEIKKLRRIWYPGNKSDN
ncbi:Uncharacterised protein [uncultured archaeon]|nr:Uncharacterised protein [uncultured archaeon]